jgi:DNA-directed RNA polymerase III subunit RPC1
MCHRARIRPWRTLRLNECVCNPYNADFDGDEMNLHVPQTEEARTEALELMSVKKNLVTPRNGEPIIAAIQDFITASFLLSRRDRFFDRQQFTQIASFLGDAELKIDIPPPAIWKPVRLWTGKQIFNLLMRPNKESNVLVNLEAKCKTLVEPAPEDNFPLDMSPNDGFLVIQNSEIMCGVFDKNTVGDGKKKSVFGVMLRDYGPEVAAGGMNRLAKVAARWLANQGFSLGINDVMPGDNLQRNKQDMVETAYEKCEDLIATAKKGKLENSAGCDQETTLEQLISGTLSKVRGAVGDVCMQELSRHNAPLIMATCGSKGLSSYSDRSLQADIQVPSLTSPRWSLVSDNKLFQEIVFPTVFKIDRFLISVKSPRTPLRRVSFETLSTLVLHLLNSCSTPSQVEKVWSILLSRLLKRVIWLVV